MSIPFTQYLRPDGRRRSVEIDRPAEVEAIAEQFIASGGRFECEVLMTGEISFTAVKEVDGEEQDVEIVICENGPGVGEKVDELVRSTTRVTLEC
jgi:hypothetical protein